jgi:hypothetical protein
MSGENATFNSETRRYKGKLANLTYELKHLEKEYQRFRGDDARYRGNAFVRNQVHNELEAIKNIKGEIHKLKFLSEPYTEAGKLRTDVKDAEAALERIIRDTKRLIEITSKEVEAVTSAVQTITEPRGARRLGRALTAATVRAKKAEDDAADRVEAAKSVLSEAKKLAKGALAEVKQRMLRNITARNAAARARGNNHSGGTRKR